MNAEVVQVGLGVRGVQWAKAIRATPSCDVVAFVARNLDRLKQRASELGFPAVQCYNDLSRALEEAKANILLLVTPPEVHHKEAMLGIEKGLHLLAEKPLTENLDEAIDIVEAAEARDLQVGVSMNFRYLAPSQEIRKYVLDKGLGKPSFSQFTYIRHRDGHRADLNSYCMTQEQPMLLEQSVHHLDLMRYCLASDVEWVQADTWNPPWSTYKDDSNVSVLLKLENGMHVNYLGTWTSGSNRLRFLWQIDFPNGTLVQNRQFRNLFISRFQHELSLTGTNFKEEDDTEPLMPVDLPKVEAFTEDSQELLRRFLKSIVDKTDFETSGKDHIKTLCVVHACIEAAKTGKRIQMNEFYKRYNVPTHWVKKKV
jgi:predicted dehydrogenase